MFEKIIDPFFSCTKYSYLVFLVSSASLSSFKSLVRGTTNIPHDKNKKGFPFTILTWYHTFLSPQISLENMTFFVCTGPSGVYFIWKQHFWPYNSRTGIGANFGYSFTQGGLQNWRNSTTMYFGKKQISFSRNPLYKPQSVLNSPPVVCTLVSLQNTSTGSISNSVLKHPTLLLYFFSSSLIP